MKLPPRNLCLADRLIRGVVAVVTLSTGLLGSSLIGDAIVQGILIAFGAANFLSLVTGWCVIYQVAGLSTLNSNITK